MNIFVIFSVVMATVGMVTVVIYSVAMVTVVMVISQLQAVLWLPKPKSLNN